MAVVSSSNNCAAALDSAGIAELFDARVAGIESTRLGLKGKPAPDTFLEAARRLGVESSRAAVGAAAVAGVAAGPGGERGAVMGLARVRR